MKLKADTDIAKQMVMELVSVVDHYTDLGATKKDVLNALGDAKAVHIMWRRIQENNV